jgi:hydrogenase expression/formation protein HypD
MTHITATALIQTINRLCEDYGKSITLMEVCGTHTVAIFKNGIRNALHRHIRLLSGPGCPVCVTPAEDIEKAIQIASHDDVILATFGDMMKTPGKEKTLSHIKAQGAAVKAIYSPMETLEIAKQNPNKKVVLFGVGFETTSPLIAATLLTAQQQGIDNLLIYPAFKLIPPALEVLLNDNALAVDGFILPGHVSAMIGLKPYQLIQDKGKPGVITGFEALDILEGIYLLIRLIIQGQPKIIIQYHRVVKEHGNPVAMSCLYRVFNKVDAKWRGLGTIPFSGLGLNEAYQHKDVRGIIPLDNIAVKEPEGCLCAQMLKGLKSPLDCKLFRVVCTLDRPVGPCMASSEGTCAAFYKYRLDD